MYEKMKVLASDNKPALILGFVVLLVIAGAFAVAEYNSGEAERLRIENSVLVGRITETESQRLDALSNADEARAWAEASTARVRELEEQLRKKPVPPQPKPAPDTLPELSSVLVNFGLTSDLTILEAQGKTILNRPDALKVYDWASQAARVPGLQEHIAGQGALIDGLKSDGAFKDKVIDSQKVVIDVTTKELGLTKQQVGVIQKEAVASARAAKIQKWLYAGGALVTGYLVGKK